MIDANLYVLLALSAKLNAILERRIKGFEMNNKSLSDEVDRQAKLIESPTKPGKTHHGKPYLRKVA